MLDVGTQTVRCVSGKTPPSIRDLERALAIIVDNIVRHRIERERSYQSRPRAPWIGTDLSAPAYVGRAWDIVSDPLTFSLKRGIKSLGQTVYDMQGMEALREIVDMVCSDGIGGFHARMSPVDDALDGVGKGSDRWHG